MQHLLLHVLQLCKLPLIIVISVVTKKDVKSHLHTPAKRHVSHTNYLYLGKLCVNSSK